MRPEFMRPGLGGSMGDSLSTLFKAGVWAAYILAGLNLELKKDFLFFLNLANKLVISSYPGG